MCSAQRMGTTKLHLGANIDPSCAGRESSFVFICFLDVLWDFGEVYIHGFPFVFQNSASK